MKIIPEYKIFLIRRYYKKNPKQERFNYLDLFDSCQPDFPQNKIFNFLYKDIFFEIYNGEYKSSANKVIHKFDRINLALQMMAFEEKEEPFTIRFLRPTNIVDADKILNNFNQIWRNEIW